MLSTRMAFFLYPLYLSRYEVEFPRKECLQPLPQRYTAFCIFHRDLPISIACSSDNLLLLIQIHDYRICQWTEDRRLCTFQSITYRSTKFDNLITTEISINPSFLGRVHFSWHLLGPWDHRVGGHMQRKTEVKYAFLYFWGNYLKAGFSAVYDFSSELNHRKSKTVDLS